MTRKSRLLFGLGAIPFFDCIFDQLNNGLHLKIGPLSLLQVVHGSLMLAFLAICFGSVWGNAARLKRVPLPAVGAFLLLAIAGTKELVVTGSLGMPSLGPYGQMAYWVLFWVTVSLVCDGREDTKFLLRGLAVGALATAVSVFLGLVFGAPNYYAEDSVASSAGWFDTGKMITGVMNTGGIVFLYLGQRRGRWIYPLLASVCFLGCVITYARAGSVALGAMLVWLPVWALVLGRGDKRRWLTRFLILCAAAVLLLPAVVDTGNLFARWADVKQGNQAGSGRATFWKIALDGYMSAPPAQQALGRGYGAMADLLFREYGMDIKHTHNDALDMLTVGGLAGVSWLLFFIGTLLTRVVQSSLLSVEGAAGMAILLNYLLHSQFTGQIWGTDAMSYYTIALTCLYINAQADKKIDFQLSTARSVPFTTHTAVVI